MFGFRGRARPMPGGYPVRRALFGLPFIILLDDASAFADPLERRPIGVSAEAARIFEARSSTATPLPTAMEISYRAIGRVPFHTLIQVQNIKALFVGEVITQNDGDALRRTYRVDYMDIERNGLAFKVPVSATYHVRLRANGEHLQIGSLDMQVPWQSPDPKYSAADWRSVHEQIIPTLTAILEKGRIEECLYLPRFPEGKVTNDTVIGLRGLREMMRRLAECSIAAGKANGWSETDEFKRDPEAFFDRMERTLASSAVKVETDIRTRGTVQMNGSEYLAMAGPMRMTGKGEQAASLFGAAIPAGVKIDTFEWKIDALTLIDPYSGAIFKTAITGGLTAYPAPGSQSSAFVTVSQKADYYAEIPRFYASVPAPPPVASPAPSPRPSAPTPSATNAPREPKTLVGLYRDAIGSVFTVKADSSLGTAFAAGGNVLITSRHVVRDTKIVDLENTQGHRFKARVLLPTGDVDIAYLVPSSPQRLVPLPMAADVPPIGTKLIVIGSPAGLDGSLTTGTVSQLRSLNGRLFLQFEGFVNAGNSGGPIMDLEGKVLGIVMARGSPEKALGVNIGVSSVDLVGEAPREAKALLAKN